MLDKTFKVSLIAKGLDGLLELVGGILLLTISPASISKITQALTQNELSRDPHDFVAMHMLHFANNVSHASAVFGALYLLSHGLVKIVLVIAVLKQKLWAYPWMIGFIGLFTIYQIYRMVSAFSIGLLLLTLFDILIIWLTTIEYRRHKRHKSHLSQAL